MEYTTLPIKLGNETYELEINFKAAYKFATELRDPSLIIRDMLKGDDSFLTLPNLVKGLQIALSASGVNKDFDKIGETIYKHHQAGELMGALGEYIGLLAMSGADPSSKKKEGLKTQDQVPPLPNL